MNFLHSYLKSDRIVLFTIFYFNIFLLYPLFSEIFVSSITKSTLNLLICSNSLSTNLKIPNKPSVGLLKKIRNTLKIIILAGGYDDNYASVETSIYKKLNDIDRCGY
jgi:hypothetical protein